MFGPGLAIRQCVHLTIFEDDIIENQEEFFLQILPAEGDAMAISVIIVDDDCKCIYRSNV